MFIFLKQTTYIYNLKDFIEIDRHTAGKIKMQIVLPCEEKLNVFSVYIIIIIIIGQ